MAVHLRWAKLEYNVLKGLFTLNHPLLYKLIELRYDSKQHTAFSIADRCSCSTIADENGISSIVPSFVLRGLHRGSNISYVMTRGSSRNVPD